MSGKPILRFRAGPGAFTKIRDEGFSPSQIGTIAGASGGAKWLVLSQIDRVVISRILPRLEGPVHLIGSSIGSWRFSCYAQQNPFEALECFEEAYLEQRYSEAPDRDEITTRSRDILQELLGDSGIREITTHPILRTHIMTVRSRALTSSEKAPVLAAGLLAAASANLLSRRTLGAFFSRGLFFDRRDLPPFFEPAGFPLHRIELTEDNYAEAVLASGAIPLVLNGVRNPSGAPAGVYRDGGIIDYHLDLDTSAPDRITLFPHFYDHLIPGWFDKKLAWRRPDPRHIDRTLLICPSDEFVAALPNAKIPDRTDFQTMSPDARRKVWRSVVASCEALAEAFNDVLDKDQLPARLEPL
ncbi:MAG: patatin-like phospholipase family protein [Woeseiaceae bacterium]